MPGSLLFLLFPLPLPLEALSDPRYFNSDTEQRAGLWGEADALVLGGRGGGDIPEKQELEKNSTRNIQDFQENLENIF